MKILRITILALLLLNSCSQRSAILTEKDGFVSADSTKMYYSIIGSGDTLVVLHGGPGLSHKYLKPQLDSLLSSNFTLLYYDQRGSGWSEGLKDTLKLNMQTYITDLDQIRSYFKLSELNLVGHSFGGLLGMYYGITYPDKLNSLVLIDTDAASYELRTPYQIKTINARLTEEQNNYLDSIYESDAYTNYDVTTYEKYYKTFLTTYFANPKDTSNLKLGFDSISVKKIDVTNKLVRKDLGTYDIHDLLRVITCPTLILQGTESVFSVEGAEAINNELVNSELHLFGDCGHFEYIEAPDKFKQLIEEFYGIN